MRLNMSSRGDNSSAGGSVVLEQKCDVADVEPMDGEFSGSSYNYISSSEDSDMETTEPMASQSIIKAFPQVHDSDTISEIDKWQHYNMEYAESYLRKRKRKLQRLCDCLKRKRGELFAIKARCYELETNQVEEEIKTSKSEMKTTDKELKEWRDIDQTVEETAEKSDQTINKETEEGDGDDESVDADVLKQVTPVNEQEAHPDDDSDDSEFVDFEDLANMSQSQPKLPEIRVPAERAPQSQEGHDQQSTISAIDVVQDKGVVLLAKCQDIQVNAKYQPVTIVNNKGVETEERCLLTEGNIQISLKMDKGLVLGKIHEYALKVVPGQTCTIDNVFTTDGTVAEIEYKNESGLEMNTKIHVFVPVTDHRPSNTISASSDFSSLSGLHTSAHVNGDELVQHSDQESVSIPGPANSQTPTKTHLAKKTYTEAKIREMVTEARQVQNINKETEEGKGDDESGEADKLNTTLKGKGKGKGKSSKLSPPPRKENYRLDKYGRWRPPSYLVNPYKHCPVTGCNWTGTCGDIKDGHLHKKHNMVDHQQVIELWKSAKKVDFGDDESGDADKCPTTLKGKGKSSKSTPPSGKENYCLDKYSRWRPPSYLVNPCKHCPVTGCNWTGTRGDRKDGHLHKKHNMVDHQQVIELWKSAKKVDQVKKPDPIRPEGQAGEDMTTIEDQ